MPDQQPTYTDQDKYLSLYRYYMWSTILRNQFQSPFKAISESDKPEERLAEWMGPLGMGDGAVFMSYWYAALYVVVEGWQELGYRDAAIDALLASDHAPRLKRHRNATCHYQKPVFVDRWNEFEREPGAVEWVRELDKEFGRYFLGIAKGRIAVYLAQHAGQTTNPPSQ